MGKRTDPKSRNRMKMELLESCVTYEHLVMKISNCNNIQAGPSRSSEWE